MLNVLANNLNSLLKKNLLSKKSVLLPVIVFGWVLGFAGIGVGGIGLLRITRATAYQNVNPAISERDSELGQILVEVAGAVNRPGIYKLPFEARVAQAVEAAGGLHLEVDQSYLHHTINLAERLTDGQKMYLPFQAEGSVNDEGSQESDINKVGREIVSNAAGQKVNLNTAPQKALEELPGIGEKIANNIIDARPISSLSELVSKKVLTQKVADQLKTLIEF